MKKSWRVLIFLFLLIGAGPVCSPKEEELPPPVVSGPSVWYTNSFFFISLTGGRAEGRRLSYQVMVDSNAPESWTAYFGDVETVHYYLCFTTTGVHSVRARVRNIQGLESRWSAPYQVTIVQSPPVPESLSGPDSGVAGYEYRFRVRAVDADGDSVAVRFDWGDGTVSAWSNYDSSGAYFSVTHVFQDTGIYFIRAQARDIHGDTSGWSAETLRFDVCRRWVTVLNEGFEQGFPGPGWQVRGDPTWDTTGYRQYSGRFSIWCAGSSREPPQGYPSQLGAFAIYGPFSLADADSARVEFRHWTDSEYGHDMLFWFVMLDSVTYYVCGQAGGNIRSWERVEVDLTQVPGVGSVCGRERVWLGWVFNSDLSTEYEGAYLDEIVIRKCVYRQE
ncbi:MAG: PKD domain-containing protein [candidate division WOR-3 bacterium]